MATTRNIRLTLPRIEVIRDKWIELIVHLIIIWLQGVDKYRY